MARSQQAEPVDVELCLDFADTIDWRTSSHAEDNLRTYSDLLAWGAKRGLVDREVEERLVRIAKGREDVGEAVLAEAKSLREAIYRIFSAVAHGGEADAADLEVLNESLARAMARASVSREGVGYRWGWEGVESADMVLFPVARSAAHLLTSEDLGRVKECANDEEGCGSMFIDRSKGQSRRWCSMQSCGNRAKFRTYYVKHSKKE